MHNITLKRIRVTTVAVEKQCLTHLCVCACARVGECVPACVRVRQQGRGGERVFALVYPKLSSTQRAAILSSVATLASSNLSTLSHKRHDFREKKLLNIKRVL
jgi:hypothetical protein